MYLVVWETILGGKEWEFANWKTQMAHRYIKGRYRWGEQEQGAEYPVEWKGRPFFRIYCSLFCLVNILKLVTLISSCLPDIFTWMSNSHFKLNTSKALPSVYSPSSLSHLINNSILSVACAATFLSLFHTPHLINQQICRLPYLKYISNLTTCYLSIYCPSPSTSHYQH